MTVSAIADGDQSVVDGAKGVYTFDLKDYKTGGTASTGGTFEAGTKTTETPTATAAGTALTAVSDWTSATGLTLVGDGTEKVSVTLGGKNYEMELVKTADPAKTNQVVVTGTESPADLTKLLETKLQEMVEADNKAGAAGTADYKKIENVSLAADPADKGKLKASADVTPMTYKTETTDPTDPGDTKGTFEAGTPKTAQAMTDSGNLKDEGVDWSSNTAVDHSGLDGKTVTLALGTDSFTVKLVANGTGTGAANEVELGTTDAPDALADKIKANLQAQIDAHNKAGEAGTANYNKIENLDFTGETDGSFTVKADTTEMTYKAPAAKAAAPPGPPLPLPLLATSKSRLAAWR